MMQAAGWLENPMKKSLDIRSRLTRKVSMPSIITIKMRATINNRKRTFCHFLERHNAQTLI